MQPEITNRFVTKIKGIEELVKIGVTGHRFLKETEKIIQGVDKALKMIDEVYGAPFIMMSSLAEGADQLIVYRAFAMRGDTNLEAFLPVKQDDYLEDFKSLTSKVELINLLEMADKIFELNSRDSREDAYLQAGRYIIDHCDVIIAVWDGQESQGEGGTADVVALARERKLPLAWVHAGNRQPGTEKPTSLGKEQGLVTFERFNNITDRKLKS